MLPSSSSLQKREGKREGEVQPFLLYRKEKNGWFFSVFRSKKGGGREKEGREKKAFFFIKWGGGKKEKVQPLVDHVRSCLGTKRRGKKKGKGKNRGGESDCRLKGGKKRGENWGISISYSNRKKERKKKKEEERGGVAASSTESAKGGKGEL